MNHHYLKKKSFVQRGFGYLAFIRMKLSNNIIMFPSNIPVVGENFLHNSKTPAQTALAARGRKEDAEYHRLYNITVYFIRG